MTAPGAAIGVALLVAAMDCGATATTGSACEVDPAGDSSATGPGGDGNHSSQEPSASMPSAITRKTSDGRHEPFPPAGSAGVGPERRGPRMTFATRVQGAVGLLVDNAQPMRSWPYWFQIGLLPAVNDV